MLWILAREMRLYESVYVRDLVYAYIGVLGRVYFPETVRETEILLLRWINMESCRLWKVKQPLIQFVSVPYSHELLCSWRFTSGYWLELEHRYVHKHGLMHDILSVRRAETTRLEVSDNHGSSGKFRNVGSDSGLICVTWWHENH
jgi:hypothetical protein